MKKNILLNVIIACLLFITSAKAQDLIEIDGKPVFMSGMNLAWVNFANDLPNLDIQAYTDYLDDLADAKGNALRWWIHVNGTNNPQFTNDSVSGISPVSISNLKQALDLAQDRGIAVSLCLWSFDMLRTNEDLSQEVLDRNEMMLNDTIYTKAYINNALIPLVTELKEHPAILCWEIFNEPEGMTNVAGWSFTRKVPISSIQRFINLCAGAIHRTDTSARVSNGSWNFLATSDLGSWTNYYRDDRLIAAGGDTLGKLDFYMVHFYGSSSTDSPFHHPKSYWGLDKPLIIGEFAANSAFPGMSSETAYNYLFDNGYAGALSWTMTGHDGNGDVNDARPGMVSLYENHADSIIIPIDPEWNYTPRVIWSISDIAVEKNSPDSIAHVNLNTIFADDSVMTYSILDADSSIAFASISNDSIVDVHFVADTFGISRIYIQAVDPGGKLGSTSFFVSIYDTTSENVALFRKTKSSTVEGSSYSTPYAVDGNALTRWSTIYTNNQWFQVEFEKQRSVSRIMLNWETAFGETYNIQTSDNGTDWTTAFAETNSDGGYDKIILDPSVNANYVRMDGKVRATEWGFSLFEFEVFETYDEVENVAPVGLPIGIQYFTVEEERVFTLDPAAGFSDANQGDKIVSLTANILGGDDFPAWLVYDEDLYRFTGTPAITDIDTFIVELTGYDWYGASGTAQFTVIVREDVSAIESIALQDKLIIYPNPSPDVFNFIIPDTKSSSVTIEIYNLTGQLIETEKFNSSVNEINMKLDLSNYPGSMYMYKVRLEEGIINGKIIKE